MSQYEVQFEVAGPAAMFARPDTGATPISYPVPTWSAAKGMFDAVVWRPHISIHPTRVEVCRPIRYERYVTNYGGPLRKQDQIKNNNSLQLHATILVDVCYRIHGEVRDKKTSTRGKARAQSRTRRGRSWRSRLKDEFNQRLAGGQTFYTPCLGWKEFVPRYFGLPRHETIREASVNEVIESLLHSMWSHRVLKPEFRWNWHIVNGVMSYENPTPEVCHVE